MTTKLKALFWTLGAFMTGGGLSGGGYQIVRNLAERDDYKILWGYVYTDGEDSVLTCKFILEHKSTKKIKVKNGCVSPWTEEISKSRENNQKGLWIKWDEESFKNPEKIENWEELKVEFEKIQNESSN